MKKIILLLIISYTIPKISNAQPGELDIAFGNNGIVTAPGGGIRSGVFQNDGKILLIGDNGILRYNSSGIIDNTFGINGVVATGFDVKSIEIVTNDKFVVAGNTPEQPGTLTADIIVARFNADGSPDNTFNGNGRQTTDFASNSYDIANSIAIQNDGKLVVCGEVVYNGNTPFLMRYNVNGSLDNTFDGDGKLVVNVRALLNNRGRSVLLEDNGKILFATSIFTNLYSLDISVFRYNSNGSRDSTFDGDGSKTMDLGYLEINTGFATLENGKIILAGQLEGKEDGYVLRLNNDGSFDKTFSNDGKLLTDFGLKGEQHFSSITLSAPGKMIIGGDHRNGQNHYFAIARFSTEGIMDTTFSGDGLNVIPGSGTINELKIFKNKLYAICYPNGIARFQLGEANNAPTVALLTPLANSTYLTGGNVYLAATASDEDGTISKVEFYKGNSLIYTATDTPYAFKWEHVNKGDYTLTAKATDNSGLVTTSDPVTISVVPNKPPTVSIINPANEQTFLKGGTIHLQAAAKDPDGRITKVEFYNGSVLLATERKFPYTYDWAKVLAGNYTITAKATDNWGAVTTSVAITVSVVSNKLPSVSITNPANGESFTAYSTINLQAAAKDPDGRITKVDFYSGTTLLATERKLPYTYQWTNARAGVYTITAVAQDNWGAVTTSAPIQIFVIAGTQCPATAQPTFGFNFNGTAVANINNGLSDSSESASISVCAGVEYTTSGHFNSSASNLYSITDVAIGGTLLFDGSADYDRVITAAELSATAGTYTITLADPEVGGTLTQTITPFTDLNSNGILDEGDCAGDPIVFTYTATPCATPVCPLTSQPTFGYNFNGKPVANINNGILDSSELGSVAICDGEQYITSQHFHNSLSTLYEVVNVPTGGALLFDGFTIYNAVLTASDLTGTAGTHTISLESPNVAGTLIQTITPFTDLNNNGLLDEDDCAGDPIIFTYTATPCATPVCPVTSQPTFGYNFNGNAVANINNGILDSSESASVIVCDGGQYTETGHFHSSSANLYNLAVTSGGGIIRVNGYVPADAVVTAAEFSGFAGTQTLTLDDPAISGTSIQTITPFTDLNNNGILDEDDCAGEPVTLYYTVNACPALQCPVSSQPSFGLNFNGTPVANVNNDTADLGESAGVNFCDGGQYFVAGHFHSSSSNLYNITVVATGGAVLFNGAAAYNIVMTAAQLSATAGNYNITLADPTIGGTVIQNITPFTDSNNNGLFDDGDCAGDPIIFTYTATPCWASGTSSTAKKTRGWH